MTDTLTAPEAPTEAPERNRRTPFWAVAMFVMGLAMALVVAPAVVPSGEGGAPAAVAEAAPADNDGAACYYPVAGWLVLEKPCEGFTHLPASVKECLFAVFGAGVVATVWGAPLAPAVAGALVGCGGKLLSS